MKAQNALLWACVLAAAFTGVSAQVLLGGEPAADPVLQPLSALPRPLAAASPKPAAQPAAVRPQPLAAAAPAQPAAVPPPVAAVPPPVAAASSQPPPAQTAAVAPQPPAAVTPEPEPLPGEVVSVLLRVPRSFPCLLRCASPRLGGGLQVPSAAFAPTAGSRPAAGLRREPVARGPARRRRSAAGRPQLHQPLLRGARLPPAGAPLRLFARLPAWGGGGLKEAGPRVRASWGQQAGSSRGAGRRPWFPDPHLGSLAAPQALAPRARLFSPNPAPPSLHFTPPGGGLLPLPHLQARVQP
jgi:hypothetical protein